MRVHIAEPSLFRIEVELMFDYERVDPLLLAVWQKLKRGRAPMRRELCCFWPLLGGETLAWLLSPFFY